MAKKQKRCSLSLVLRKMQIKTTMRYNFTFVRMHEVKETKNPGLVRMWRELELSYVAGRLVN